jgi:putative transposase
MPRRQRHATAGIIFHVLNRGARRMRVFDSPGDYYRFLELLGRAQRRTQLELLAYCLMPNHFHLVARPAVDGQLSNFMHWLCTKHAQGFQAIHGTEGTGCVYQGRFKAIPVSSDLYFLRLCRYVERNALQASLVDRAESWQWSSLAQRQGLRRPVRLSTWPIPIPEGWLDYVNEEVAPTEVQEIRTAVRRGSPYGPEEWREQMGTRLGLMGTIRPIGRPKTKT